MELRPVPPVFSQEEPVGSVGGAAVGAHDTGGRLRGWLAWVPPMAVMAVSDLLLERLYGYPPFNKWAYAGFLVYVLLGRWLARTDSPARSSARGATKIVSSPAIVPRIPAGR